MESGSLKATTSGGTQSATGTPQSAGAGGFSAGQQASSVQPGTPRDALNNQGGIPLSNTQLSTVSLTATGTAKTEPAVRPEQPRDTNPFVAGFSLLLVAVALVLIVSAFRPVKKTTD